MSEVIEKALDVALREGDAAMMGRILRGPMGAGRRQAAAPSQGADLADMTPAQARAVLHNTLGQRADVVERAEAVMAQFRATKPAMPCRACGSMRWGMVTDDQGAPAWACEGCHLPAMTDEQWAAHQAHRAALRASAVTAPQPPRDMLADTQAELNVARSHYARFEGGAPVARQAVTDAREALDKATAALAHATQRHVAARVTALTAFQPRQSRQESLFAERTAVDDAASTLELAQAARGCIEVDLAKARDRVATLESSVQRAADLVLVAEAGPVLVARVREAAEAMKADLLALMWLQQRGPVGAEVAAILGGMQNNAPANWPAVRSNVGMLEMARVALLRDPYAPVLV
jgi:hypothetical protein